MFGEEAPIRQSYSYAAYESDSEFSQAVRGKETDRVYEVMDELMKTLSVINPRLYEGVLAKISSI